jgi:nicotinamidase-related amidase
MARRCRRTRSRTAASSCAPWTASRRSRRLVGHGIRRLIVAGIRTEQCCETTTRHASDEGWEVDYCADATLTFDMKTPAGATLTAAEIRERTETVLVDRFCTLVDVGQALARAA